MNQEQINMLAKIEHLVGSHKRMRTKFEKSLFIELLEQCRDAFLDSEKKLLSSEEARVKAEVDARNKAIEDAAKVAFKTCWELGNVCTAGTAAAAIPHAIRAMKVTP